MPLQNPSSTASQSSWFCSCQYIIDASEMLYPTSAGIFQTHQLIEMKYTERNWSMSQFSWSFFKSRRCNDWKASPNMESLDSWAWHRESNDSNIRSVYVYVALTLSRAYITTDKDVWSSPAHIDIYQRTSRVIGELVQTGSVDDTVLWKVSDADFGICFVKQPTLSSSTFSVVVRIDEYELLGLHVNGHLLSDSLIIIFDNTYLLLLL